MSDRIESDDQTTAGAGTGQQRTAAEARQHADDPDALVAEIERTRDDLAETMDAIVDKVSPKKVAQRSKEKATETIKEKVAVAKEVVTEKAAVAREVVTEKAVAAKETVAEKAAVAKDTVNEKAAAAKESVSAKTAQARPSHGSDASSVAVDPVAGAGLPPVTGVQVPPLPTGSPAYGTVGSDSGSGSGSGGGAGGDLASYISKIPPVRKEVLAGGALALVALLLLRRRGSGSED